MRLKFNRVQESALPRAHGAEVKDAIDDPSTLNLGGVIDRMRQGSGPDISDFQSRVSAAEASVQDAVFGMLSQYEDAEPIFTPPLAPADSEAGLEPYNPAMLSRLCAPRGSSGGSARQQSLRPLRRAVQESGPAPAASPGTRRRRSRILLRPVAPRTAAGPRPGIEPHQTVTSTASANCLYMKVQSSNRSSKTSRA